jgi:hypothetical protein
MKKILKTILKKLILRQKAVLGIFCFLFLLNVFTSAVFASTTANSTVTVIVPTTTPSGSGGGGSTYKSPSKAMTAFTISGQIGATNINETAHTVLVTMPYGTNVTALAPVITITGSLVNPASGIIRNFTNSQTYIVTAADNSTQNYVVTVNIAPAIPTTCQSTDWFIRVVKRTDIVCDGKIDILDFNTLMVNWGKNIMGNSADVNRDGLIDILDFNFLMVHWGKSET